MEWDVEDWGGEGYDGILRVGEGRDGIGRFGMGRIRMGRIGMGREEREGEGWDGKYPDYPKYHLFLERPHPHP